MAKRNPSLFFHPLVWAGMVYLMLRTGVWLNRFGGGADQAGAWLCWAAVAAGAISSVAAAAASSGAGHRFRFVPLLVWGVVMAELFIAGS